MSDFGQILKLLVEGDGEMTPQAQAAGATALQTTDPGEILTNYVTKHKELADVFNTTVSEAFSLAEKTLGSLGNFKFIQANGGGMKALLPASATMAQAGPLRNVPNKGMSPALANKLQSLKSRQTGLSQENHDFSELLSVFMEAPSSNAPDISTLTPGPTPEANRQIGIDYTKAKEAISTLLDTFRNSYRTYKQGTDILLQQLKGKLPDIIASHGYAKVAHTEAEQYKKQIHEITVGFKKQKELYDQEIQSLQLMNEKLQEQLKEAQASIEDQRQKWAGDLAQSGQDAAAAQSKMAQQQAELENRKTKIDEIEGKFSQKQAQLEAKQQEVDQAAAAVKHAQQQLQNSMTKQAIDQTHIKDYREAVELFNQEFQELHELSAKFQAEGDVMRERLMQLGGYSKGESFRCYGKFNLMEHLARATKGAPRHESNW